MLLASNLELINLSFLTIKDRRRVSLSISMPYFVKMFLVHTLIFLVTVPYCKPSTFKNLDEEFGVISFGIDDGIPMLGYAHAFNVDVVKLHLALRSTSNRLSIYKYSLSKFLPEYAKQASAAVEKVLRSLQAITEDLLFMRKKLNDKIKKQNLLKSKMKDFSNSTEDELFCQLNLKELNLNFSRQNRLYRLVPNENELKKLTNNTNQVLTYIKQASYFRADLSDMVLAYSRTTKYLLVLKKLLYLGVRGADKCKTGYDFTLNEETKALVDILDERGIDMHNRNSRNDTTWTMFSLYYQKRQTFVYMFVLPAATEKTQIEMAPTEKSPPIIIIKDSKPSFSLLFFNLAWFVISTCLGVAATVIYCMLFFEKIKSKFGKHN